MSKQKRNKKKDRTVEIQYNIKYITREQLNAVIDKKFVPYADLDLLVHGYFVFILYNTETGDFITCCSFDDEEDIYTKNYIIYNKNKQNYDYALFVDLDQDIYYCLNTNFAVKTTNKKTLIRQFEDWLYSKKK